MKVSHVNNLDASKYQAGDIVRFEKITYTVVAASHAHVQLDGLTKAVPAWLVKKVNRKAK